MVIKVARKAFFRFHNGGIVVFKWQFHIMIFSLNVNGQYRPNSPLSLLQTLIKEECLHKSLAMVFKPPALNGPEIAIDGFGE